LEPNIADQDENHLGSASIAAARRAAHSLGEYGEDNSRRFERKVCSCKFLVDI
jgi:hypothetical protein